MMELTIYTPTFNRVHLLPRLVESLCCQTSKDFLWVVIDDGSTDGTKDYIEQLKRNNLPFPIEYYYKKNGGVHTARDYAYHVCHTELIMSVDSDDWLLDDAVESILTMWNKNKDPQCIGIISQAEYPDGGCVCKNFPLVDKASCQEFVYKYGCKSEKQTIVLSKIMKNLSDFPVFDNENVVGENYKWIQLPKDKYFMLMSKPIEVCDYQPNGYTANASKYFLNNPLGFRAMYREYIVHGQFIRARIKGHLGYIAACLYLGKLGDILKSPKPFISLLLMPFGVCSYIYLKKRVSVFS